MGIIPTRNFSLCLLITFCIAKKVLRIIHCFSPETTTNSASKRQFSPYVHLLKDFLSTVQVICSILWPLTRPLATRFLLDVAGQKRSKTSKLSEGQDCCADVGVPPLKCTALRPLLSCPGGADPELVTVRVLCNLGIALEDSWRTEETLASHQPAVQALQLPSRMGLATAVPLLFVVPEGKCHSIQTFTNLF